MTTSPQLVFQLWSREAERLCSMSLLQGLFRETDVKVGKTDVEVRDRVFVCKEDGGVEFLLREIASLGRRKISCEQYSHDGVIWCKPHGAVKIAINRILKISRLGRPCSIDEANDSDKAAVMIRRRAHEIGKIVAQ
jgi:hypothetical protein